MKTKKEFSAVQSLRNANKQTKTISGVCKLIRTFWNEGYKEAFEQFGLNYKTMTAVPLVLGMCQANEDGNVYLVSKKAKKDEDGNFILDNEGKKVYETYNKVVTTWTATTLFKVLQQSKDNK